ncbi:class I SAM-dependent methyltransferase [Methyloligella sp. 2.7D]|uniref:class I SAM-dependent methyltransferase n=1 Tax=unclassified Methyloligella TaxID=2625955 RepID=UPI00157E1A0D|nr:class I SAM-dependent methyltransferase [Methyloligella sp. GL2]QKP78196.1 class I SAM-dependent methyltransferase [Methyloligella sp. GL2]
MSQLTDLVNYDNPNSLGSRFRSARKQVIADLIEAVFAKQGQVRIADLGGREVYWKIFGADYLQQHRVSIALINPEPQQASASPLFKVVQGDACALEEFESGSFDLVHSNSTIEHVGLWPKMEAFAETARRLAPAYYIQTPYYWFPVEPHAIAPLYHWLPDSWRAKLMLKMRLGNYPRAADMGEAMRAVQDAIMLDRAQMKALFPDAEIRFEWLGPLPKSLMAIRREG